ncbi:MAG: RNA polymerase sigma factor, RpoD/SigA family, partial [Okeania sp. SIO4D6]|nr:RNA polymerase sigma factor, RpoD/SigA family [Okeania sp. SIO4D6]
MIAMSATYRYTEESEEKLQDNNLQTNISEDIEQIIDKPETNELEMEDGETENAQKSTNRSTTDLVRLYLQEIGRVDLLERDQEVSEAQKVKRYVELWELLNESAKEEEGVIQCYVQLIEIRNRLTAQLGHRPSLERWAKAADIPVVELKPALTAGKLRWAELAGLTVKELEQAQSDGIKAKDHMINANLRLVV